MNDESYWKVKVLELHESEKGRTKKVTVEILVKGPSATYAETKVTELYQGTVFEWEVTSAQKTKIQSVIEAELTTAV